jgi:phospholipase C
MWFTSLVLDALVANPAVWSKTALFLMYDENDGFFDHVPPPTAPAGTPGEYLTVPPSSLQPGASTETLGITGPLGLGFRVPMLVISPFSAGGHIVSDTFDHTSQLQLIGARFGVEVPNVSAWRLATVGDLTSTLTSSAPSTDVPTLPKTAPHMPLLGACSELSQITESGGAGPTVPTKQTMPVQGGGTEPASAYFELTPEQASIPDDSRTSLAFRSPGPQTTKSSYNRLAAEPLLEKA